MIEVVEGLIVRDGRVLLVQRKPGTDFALQWELPGGKVEGDESHHEALARELREELGVEVCPIPAGLQAFFSDRFDNDVTRSERKAIFLLMYAVTVRGEPRALEGHGLGWFRASELRVLDAAPALTRARQLILSAIERRPLWSRSVGDDESRIR